MTADEARQMMIDATKSKLHSSIRKEINKRIAKAAKSGDGSTEIFIYKDHNQKCIIDDLINDGFSVKCENFSDYRETLYKYKISWSSILL